MSRYSNSYISQFASCPLSCRYKYDLYLQPAEAAVHDLAFGRAVHKALEVIHVEQNLKKAKAVFIEHYPTQLDPNDLAKTQANGLFALDKYIETYQWDQNWKVLAAEEMDSTEDGYVVKLDLVVEEKSTGSIYGIDHKATKAYLDYRFFSKFSPNSQVTQYFRYIKEKFGACDGFYINALSFIFLKRNGPKRSAGFNIEFERMMLTRTQQQIDQEQESKQYWIERIEDAKTKGVWGMNTSHCFLCDYQPICSAGWTWEQDSELVLNTFRQVHEKWIPEENGHCQLDLGHEGDCSSQVVRQEETEFVVEV